MRDEITYQSISQTSTMVQPLKFGNGLVITEVKTSKVLY